MKKFTRRLQPQYCFKCKQEKNPQAFLQVNVDPEGWCRRCRKAYDIGEQLPDDSPSDGVEIKLAGEKKVLRVRVIGGVVVLTAGYVDQRKIREVIDPAKSGGTIRDSFQVTRVTECFVEAATITVPFRALDELREALDQVSRLSKSA